MYIYLLLIMGAFGAIVGPLLGNPSVPIGFLILVLAGMLAGQMTYRWKTDLVVTTIVTVLIALVGIYIGTTSWAQNLIIGINGGAESPVLFSRPLGYGDVTWAAFFWAVVMLIF